MITVNEKQVNAVPIKILSNTIKRVHIMGIAPNELDGLIFRVERFNKCITTFWNVKQVHIYQ